MSTPEDDGFLKRWSKRKLEDAPEEQIVEDAPPPDPELEFEGKTDDEILEALKLPDPDTLKAGDNFKAFMNSAVPTRLRNRALRKLWVSNPVLANLDELLDYGEDFTDAATVVENLQTAYQVGRGFVIEEKEVEDALEDAEVVASDAESADPEAALEEAEQDEPQGEEDAPEPEVTPPPEPIAEKPEPVLAKAEEPDLEADLMPPYPRRMRFSFDEA